MTERRPGTYAFNLVDGLENFDLCDHCASPPRILPTADSSAVTLILVNSIIASRHDPSYLKDLATDLGWEKVANELIIPLLPDNWNTMAMEFGEALTEELLKFHGYEIPIPKRRYTIRKNQTLPGDDSLAIKVVNNKIVEMCYVESKLRNSEDTKAGIDAYDSLKTRYMEELPVLINFNLRRMYETKHALFVSLKEYLRDRTDTDDKDTFCISLTFDRDLWNEANLVSIDNALKVDKTKLVLPPLLVLAVRIRELGTIVKHVFATARTP